MNKKVISLILAALVCSGSIISCGNKDASTASSNTESSTENTDETEKEEPTSPDEIDTTQSTNVNPNVNGGSGTDAVNKVIEISDFKNKNADSIKTILGEPTKTEDNVSTYQKDNYTFEITYFNSICGKIKVTSKDEYNYPADGANLLKLLGITPIASDEFYPSYMVWNNKFDTYKISIYSDPDKVEDGKVADKIGYLEVILDEQYK